MSTFGTSTAKLKMRSAEGLGTLPMNVPTGTGIMVCPCMTITICAGLKPVANGYLLAAYYATNRRTLAPGCQPTERRA
jgi:hypothetical protein